MPIIASKSAGSDFQTHPEGPFAAICCDIHDLGMMEVTWEGVTKQQHKVDIYFFCGEFKDDDPSVPLLVRSRFTLTLDERGRLRPFLQSWRGKAFTPEEEAGFDLEKLLLAPAFLQVSHNHVNGKVYANIDAIMRLPKQQSAPDLPADFIRPSQRPPREENGNGHGNKQQAAPAQQRQPAAAGAKKGGYDDFEGGDFPQDDDLPF